MRTDSGLAELKSVVGICECWLANCSASWLMLAPRREQCSAALRNTARSAALAGCQAAGPQGLLRHEEAAPRAAEAAHAVGAGRIDAPAGVETENGLALVVRITQMGSY